MAKVKFTNRYKEYLSTSQNFNGILWSKKSLHFPVSTYFETRMTSAVGILKSS